MLLCSRSGSGDGVCVGLSGASCDDCHDVGPEAPSSPNIGSHEARPPNLLFGSLLFYFIYYYFFFFGGGGAVEGAERWCELSIDHRLVNVIKSVMVIMNLSSLIDYAIVVIFLSVVIKRNNMSF